MENKDTRVSGNGLSREEKIKHIYDTIIPYHRDLQGTRVYKNQCMIGDILDWIGHNRQEVLTLSKQYKPHYILVNLFIFWEKKRKPIEDQSDNCIDYIYSLL